MKIETKLTDRDLKLITIVGSIAIVFVLLWVCAKPMWEEHQELDTQLATQTERQKQATDTSLTDSLKQSTLALNEQLKNGTLKGYQTGDMTAATVTNLATGMANSHGLRVTDLSFALPTTGSYATAPEYAPAGDASASSSGKSSSKTSTVSKGATEAEAGDLTGIYQTNVQMTVSGSRDQIQTFINDCATTYPGVRVVDFQWSQASVSGQGDDGWHLAIDLAIYSYEG